MGGIKKFKRGDKGENLKFLTRNEAIKKLQVSLKVFRKLCILKGVHPRDPKKKLKGANKTYYYSKDIKFLQNEKILEIIRSRRSFKEKEKKLISRKEFGSLKKLKENRPMITLDHIIRERYPTFQDALKDLDDCLSLIHLFANMDASPKIRENQILACEKLSREFQYFITQSKSLRKVFVSVKGVYYQAEIMGETITWLTPINYLSKKEKEVDYGVMISFLEFYQALLKFVNYRLYSSIGLEYPPKLDESKLKKGEGLSSIFESTKQLKNKTTSSTTTSNKASSSSASAASNKVSLPKAVDPKLKKLEEKISKINSKEEKEIKEQTEDNNAGSLQVNSSGISKDFADLVGDENTDDIPKIMDISSLFKGFHFYVGREVPRGMLEFTVLSFGGKISFQGGNIKESSQSITHQIVDRTTATKTYHTREYIQPQWVFDSINSKILLPYSEYTIGVIPPPHLSPFVEYDEDSYIPARRAALDELINSKGFDQAKFSVDQEAVDSDDDIATKEKEDGDQEESDEEESDDEDDEDLEHLESRYTEELRQEQNKKRKSPEVDEDEQDEDEEDDEDDEEEEEEQKPEAKQVLTKKQREELKKQKQAEEDTKLAELMIRKKDKWIYNKVKETNQQKSAANQNLLDKRNKVESGKDVNGKEKATPVVQQKQTTPKKQTTPQKPQQKQPTSKKQKK